MTCGCQQMAVSGATTALGALRTTNADQRNLSGQLKLVTFREQNLGALGATAIDQVSQMVAQLEADQGSLENDLAVLVASGGGSQDQLAQFQALTNETSDTLLDLEDHAKSLGDAAVPGWVARAQLLSSSIAAIRHQVAGAQAQSSSGSTLRAVLIGGSAVLAAAILVGTLAMNDRARPHGHGHRSHA